MINILSVIDIDMREETISFLIKRLYSVSKVHRLSYNKYKFIFKRIPVTIILLIKLEVGHSAFTIDIKDLRTSKSPYLNSDTKDTLLDTDRLLFYFKRYILE